MEKVHSRIINKLMICIIAVLMLCNFVMPNYAYAKTDTQDGGDLLVAVAKFVAFLDDKVMQWLQNSFMSMDDIEQEDGKYNFQYSPGIIFSGQVPALDVNFIEPNEDKKESEGGGFTASKISNNISNYYNKRTLLLDNSIEFGKKRDEAKAKYPNYCSGQKNYSIVSNYNYYAYFQDDYVIIYFETNTLVDAGSMETTYGCYSTNTVSSATYESTAAKLQDTIASWYQALRKIALVGLLSVLIYIGIRIVLSSASPQEQSKYKKMITDWLVAICLLFTLHYIMSLTMFATNEISKIFATGETDTLLNTLRETIKSGNGKQTWGAVMGEVIMYTALVVFTVTFTVQYIKRVIYMAFFTMIAPLITLTYPLDKIKDGQAQAFTMWIREYVFNALIQVVHLLIYYVLVSSALQLVDVYPLYAIITLMFMKQAENIIKKMFGFDKAETISALGAAAAGSLVMNAVSSLTKSSKSGGDSKKEESENQSKPARTVTDPLAGLRGANSNQEGPNNSSPEYSPVRESESSEPDGGFDAAQAFAAQSSNGSAEPTGGTPSANVPSQNTGGGRKRNILKGITALGKRYVGPNLPKLLKGAAGGFMGLAGATIGFAGGVAQGDLKSAFVGATGGFAAGKNIGTGAVEGFTNLAEDIPGIGDAFRGVRETFMGGEYGSIEDVEAIKSAGITDEDEIEKILAGSDGDISKAIGYYTLAKNCPAEIYNDDKKLEEYLINLGLSETKAKEMRENMARFR